MYKCLTCGYEGKCKAYHLLEGQGCPRCRSSRGERRITIFLNNYDIIYEAQKKYSDLTGVKGGLLSYDFYLPNYNLLIEYQGEQHKKVVDYFGGESGLKVRQEHDYRKKQYAKEHNIQYMIRGLRNNMDYNYEENIAEVNKLINPDMEYIYFRAEEVGLSSSMVKELLWYNQDVSSFLPKAVYKIVKKKS